MKYFILIFLTSLAWSCKQDQKPVTTVIKTDSTFEQLNAEIEKNPTGHGLFYERAKLFYQKESYDEALDDIGSALKVDSINPDYYHLQADIFLDYYRSKQALETMEKVVELHPTRIQSLLKLCEFQFLLKQYENSMRTINHIVRIDPMNAEAYLMLGLNFKEGKLTDKAINALQTSVEFDPELIDSWILLGELYADQKDKKALQCFDNALRIKPQSIEAMHSKAFYLQNNDRVTDALDTYREIKLIDRKYADAFLNSGILYLELDSLDRAWEEFNIMANVDPQNPMAYYYRGIASEMKNDIPKARQDYENALVIDSKFDRAKQAINNLPRPKQ